MKPPRPRACHPSVAIALTLAASACFTPTGSPGTATEAASTAATTGTATTASTTTTTSGIGTDSAPTSGPETTITATSTSTSVGSTVDPTADVTSTEPGSTTGEPGVCGNGVIEALEMCDDGDLLAGGCPANCQFPGPVRYVFVTGAIYGGKIGSVADASAACNEAAQSGSAAKILAKRTFVAWLSSLDEVAPPLFGEPGGPYVMLDGTVVADSLDIFGSQNILAPIDIQESGALTALLGRDCMDDGQGVWTGTMPGGSLGEHCNTWTTTDPLVFGTVGSFVSNDGAWTNCSSRPCSSAFRLYCIETEM